MILSLSDHTGSLLPVHESVSSKTRTNGLMICQSLTLIRSSVVAGGSVSLESTRLD